MRKQMKMKIKAKIGGMTLIGVIKNNDGPTEFGNCFSFTTLPDQPFDGGIKCVNMNAESAEVAFEKFLDDELVEVERFDDGYAYITDERIPKEWLQEKICHICCPSDTRDKIERFKEKEEKRQKLIKSPFWKMLTSAIREAFERI